MVARVVSRMLCPAWTAGLAAAVIFASSARGQQLVESAFVRGDANIDGETDVSDAVHMLLCRFAGTRCSSCADATDVNDDGAADISDPVYLLAYLFTAGPRPPAPHATCGPDPTADDLDCQSFPRCAGEDAILTSRGELAIVPIEHASLVMLWDGKAIYADPDGGGGQFAGLPAADIVVVTHAHGDHTDADTLRAVVDESTVLVAPAEVLDALAGSGVLEVVDERELANGESVVIGDIEIDAVPAYNVTPERLRYHERGRGNGYVLDLDGARVYISGDTEDIPEMRALRDIDLAFICMNLPYTMTPAQAASAVLEFRPRVVYPYHYRGQDPEVFKALVEAESQDIDVRLRDWYP